MNVLLLVNGRHIIQKPSKQINQLLKKGLSGEDIALLSIKHFWEHDNNRKLPFSDEDLNAMQSSLMTPDDVAVYNRWVKTYKNIYITIIETEIILMEAVESLYRIVPWLAEHTKQYWLHATSPPLSAIEIEAFGSLTGWQTSLKSQLKTHHFQSPLEAFHTLYQEADKKIREVLASQKVIEQLSDATGVTFRERFDNKLMPALSIAIITLNYYINRYNTTIKLNKIETEILPLIDLDNLEPDPDEINYYGGRVELTLGHEWQETLTEMSTKRSKDNQVTQLIAAI